MRKLISTVKAVILGSLESFAGSHIHNADQDTAGQGRGDQVSQSDRGCQNRKASHGYW